LSNPLHYRVCESIWQSSECDADEQPPVARTRGAQKKDDMPISEQTYERVSLEDGDEQWELVCGRLRKKPAMTIEHNMTPRKLARLLDRQLDPELYVIAENSAKLRVASGTFQVPDLCVIPMHAVERLRRERPRRLEVYEEPLPLVVEVWSPSTGEYDVDTKLPEYQRRGDLEIWRLHPYERSLIAWRRQPDASYGELRLGGAATAEPVALPGVRVDLASLFV
jgi:Uma2 family endonuclease